MFYFLLSSMFIFLCGLIGCFILYRHLINILISIELMLLAITGEVRGNSGNEKGEESAEFSVDLSSQ